MPWKPGGGTQVLYALVEKTISEMDTPYNLKVVTVPGQGGNKGAKQAAKAKPDGCTLFAIHQSAITSFLNGRIDFHYNGFDAVANVTITPDIIGAAGDAPFDTIEDMIAHAKANPGQVTAGATFGSTSHFIWLLLQKATGVKLKLVPYDGTAERMNALLSGAITLAVRSMLHLARSISRQGLSRHWQSPMITVIPSCLILQHSKSVGSI